ncbi:MAG: hypothetical protein SPF89_03815 [Sphaerochaetaceae bacterium]|nr:hypothetical protein [Spirochaetales bacterium]MDY5499212.1 hypothetical protein [Sphaerochaetaceae bacterium]
MRSIIALLLALLCVCCSTSSKAKASYSQQQEEAALRSALVVACEQVDPDLFTRIPLESYLGDQAKAMAEHSEIPLIRDRLESWKTSMAELFRQMAEQSKILVEGYASSLVIDDPGKLMEQDDGMSSLLEEQAGAQWQAKISQELEPGLTVLLHTLSTIATDYEIWARGKQATNSGSYPAITLPSIEDFGVFFHDQFLAELKKEEIDVRTTPRPLGTGSLYEFFSGREH